jgi:hypothetical protein
MNYDTYKLLRNKDDGIRQQIPMTEIKGWAD